MLTLFVSGYCDSDFLNGARSRCRRATLVYIGVALPPQTFAHGPREIGDCWTESNPPRVHTAVVLHSSERPGCESPNTVVARPDAANVMQIHNSQPRGVKRGLQDVFYPC